MGAIIQHPSALVGELGRFGRVLAIALSMNPVREATQAAPVERGGD